MYKPQHLHPLGILDFLVKNIYKLLQALLPAVILLYSNPAGRTWVLPAAVFLLLIFLLYAVFYWYRYVYYIKDNELRLEYGVLSRKKRYLPLERIQSVQLSAGLLQRLLGLVKVQIDTAGGGNKAEVLLSSISKEQAEYLRQALQAGAAHPVGDENRPELVEYRLSGWFLFLAATTSNRIGFIFAGIWALLSQVDQFFPHAKVYQLLERYGEGVLNRGWTVIILAAVSVLLLAWFISLLSEMIKLGGFHLLVEGDSIKISRGLLEKQQVTLPLKRIQAVQVIESLLRQPFGLVSLQVVSAAYGGEKGEANLLFPLLSKKEVLPFLARVLPELEVSDFDLEGLPRRASRRYFLYMLIPVLLVTSVCSKYVPWGYYSWLLLPPTIWLAYRQYKDAGWKLDESKLLIRTRILGQVTTIIPRRRIQSLCIAQSYFQKRSGLSTIKAAVASGIGAVTVKAVGMEQPQINLIEDWFGTQQFINGAAGQNCSSRVD